jgi:hypothetical protein
MKDMAGSSSIPSSSECDCVLERLWGQPFGGLNYKITDVIKQGRPTPPLPNLITKTKLRSPLPTILVLNFHSCAAETYTEIVLLAVCSVLL